MAKRRDDITEDWLKAGERAKRTSNILREIMNGGSVIEEIRASLEEGQKQDLERGRPSRGD